MSTRVCSIQHNKFNSHQIFENYFDTAISNLVSSCSKKSLKNEMQLNLMLDTLTPVSLISTFIVNILMLKLNIVKLLNQIF